MKTLKLFWKFKVVWDFRENVPGEQGRVGSQEIRWSSPLKGHGGERGSRGHGCGDTCQEG